MKTIFKVLMMSVTLLLTLVAMSCTSETERARREVAKVHQQCIDACAGYDFIEARKMVAKIEGLQQNVIASIKNDAMGYSITKYEAEEQILKEQGKMDDILKYVNDKEVYYLLASNSQENADRIVYLYNAYEEEQLPDMSDVLEVAISNDNDYLARKLIKGGVDPSKKTLEMITFSDDNEMKTLIVDAKMTALKSASLPQRPQLGRIRVFTKKYYNEKTTREYAKGTPIPEDLERYVSEIYHFNEECIRAIKIAKELGLNKKNQEAYSLMQPNIEYTNVGAWPGESEYYPEFHAFSVKLNRRQIEEAAKLLK